MHIEKISLSNMNKLITDYKNHEHKITQFFDYLPYDTYDQRLKDLQKRTYNREALVNILLQLNQFWDATPETIANIKRLQDERSVVVIGGQQAGLLTGPMYTINKVISLIQLAKREEKKLGIPVIPVFWIAGEDHDYDEINHTFMPSHKGLVKHTLDQYVGDKRSVTNIPKDASKIHPWLQAVFSHLQETEYTKDLYEAVLSDLDKSANYVDFFARMINRLFKDEGVVLVDSANELVRGLESDYFTSMIQSQSQIAESVYETKQQLEQNGYNILLDAQLDDGHLFYNHHGERILLRRESDTNWLGKQQEVELSHEALLDIAKTSPHLLSNNVVTRPIMQELLFPTLVFVGGNGEIAYWAALKGAFHILGLKMPPVLPRLSFTYIDKQITKNLKALAIEAEDVIGGSVPVRRINWLNAQTNLPIEHVTNELKSLISNTHQPLRELAKGIRADIGNLAEANLLRIHQEIDFLKERIHDALEEKYEVQMKRFNDLESTLLPFGGLQERVWNPLYWLNAYGDSFIHTLANESCSFKEDHYFVYI